MHLDQFNVEPQESLQRTLLACCDVPSWAQAVIEGRPYADLDALVAAADTAARRLTADEVERAIAAHPRIGERAQGQSTHASWSRGEQAGVSQDDQTKAALLDGNRAYEERFGKVFLICASGLSAEQILTRLNERLTNDDDTESAVIADELRKIALVRLRKAVVSAHDEELNQ